MNIVGVPVNYLLFSEEWLPLDVVVVHSVVTFKYGKGMAFVVKYAFHQDSLVICCSFCKGLYMCTEYEPSIINDDNISV